MRTLNIVRRSGGWKDTISLSNVAFKEEDLADIAKILKAFNPSIQTDQSLEELLNKYERVSKPVRPSL
jgi:hypothetical protein